MRSQILSTIALLGLGSVVLLTTGCGGTKQACGTPGCNRDVTAGREVMQLFLDQGTIADADSILKDVWPVPRYQPVQLPPPSQLTWQEDPYQDKYWRFNFYSFRPMANLLFAFQQTGKKEYRDKIMAVLQSFTAYGKENEFTKDKHTTAYRGMMLVNIYGKLDRNFAMLDTERKMVLDLIEQTGSYMADPAHFDTDYNHGTNEASALLLIAENHPELPEAAAWGQTARDRLSTLLTTAVGTDGVANELSPYYHYYILQVFWQVLGWARTNGISIPSQIEPTVQGMLRYGSYIVQPDGYIPMLAASLARNVPYYEPDVMGELRGYDRRFDYILSQGKTGTKPDPADRFAWFDSAQIAVLRSDFGPRSTYPTETHIVFDMTPYRTVQSQYDALNVDLYSAGRRLLTDSGLFSYEAGPDRAYFISTRAHNTVVVDDSNQIEGAPTPGLGQVGDPWIYQSGSHTLYSGVTHRRGVLLLERDLVVVLDQLDSAQLHTYTQAWHFQPDLEIAAAASGEPLAVDAKDSVGVVLAVRQALPTGVTQSQAKGATTPEIDGWYSEDYQVKVPNWALHYDQQGTSASYLTLLASGPYAAASPQIQGTLGSFRVCAKDQGFQVSITNLAAPGESIHVTNLGACGP